MDKFFVENYRIALRDVTKLFELLERLHLQQDSLGNPNLGRPSADALLLAAIEIWKHQNPWIGKEYGEEPF